MDDRSNKIICMGCGILQKEVACLIVKNRWPLETHFVCSSLHVDFERLASALNKQLSRFHEERVVVFYGACHPLMGKFLARRQRLRTEGQNCIEMLLGKERFTRELMGGAFFLLEDWVRRWEFVTGKITFGNPSIRAEIFRQGHSRFLAIRTPCSSDFSVAAETISQEVGLPIEWTDVTLDNLERVLYNVIQREQQQKRPENSVG